jgi:hypothetical protein
MSAFHGFIGKNFKEYSSLKFENVEAVVVSGDGPNFCGHMMLRVDDYYFHVSGVYNYPMFMTVPEFRTYIKDNNSREPNSIMMPS